MSNLPTGTVTFFFTDIEGSTTLWQKYPAAMPNALARHHEILSRAVASHNGYIFQIIGDAFCAAFSTVADGLDAAVAAQRALRDEPWGETGAIRVRMALHTGAAEVRAGEFTSGEYVSGLTLSRAARLLSAGHGGQILLSLPAAELVRDHLPKDTTLREMGARRLKDLIRPEQVFQVVAVDLPADFAPLKTLDAHPHNLPVQLTSFVGREREMSEVKRLLANTHLLTLTGAGGTGKTRLSLQVAADLIDEFPDGVWFVEFAPLTDPALIPQTVVAGLGLREEAGRSLTAILSDHLRAKTSLLILDNCEHLIADCARFADTILRAAPKTKILATSREAMSITGETTYRVPSLLLPPRDLPSLGDWASLSQYEAVRLFIDRALAIQPEFSVTNANAPAVAQICHQLDGIPLALELAAARVRALSVEQIAARLDDRFRLLTGGSRTALPRQQTLRALVAWSFSLLSADERRLFRRLSVFVGGWTWQAAEAVCANPGEDRYNVLDTLTLLVDKSLVMVERDGETRYRFLETIRQYARDQLFESDETDRFRTRHADFFLTFAEQAEPQLIGAEQVAWLNRLETEHDNLRAALEWMLKAQPESNARLACALAQFWDTRGYFAEGRQWLEKALAATQHSPTPIRLKVINSAAGIAGRQSDLLVSKQLVEEGLGLARTLGDRESIARGLAYLATLGEAMGDPPESIAAFYGESLKLWHEIGDKRGIGQATGPLAARAFKQFDYTQAARLYGESLALFREVADEREIAGALGNLAEVAIAQHDYARAREQANGSLALFRKLSDKHGIATALRALGEITHQQGDPAHAQTLLEESVALFRELGDPGCLALTLIGLSQVEYAQGNLSLAASLGKESTETLRTFPAPNELTLALNLLGRIALAQGELPRAREYFSEALDVQRKLWDKRIIASLLDSVSMLLASTQPQRAVTWLCAAEALRELIATPISPVARADYELTQMTLRIAVSDDEFSVARDEGRAMILQQDSGHALEQAIEYALKEGHEPIS